MKTKAIIISTAVLLYSAAIAQPAKVPNFRKHKSETHKIAFISTHLDLTIEEAQKFWPLYNQYQKEIGSMKKNYLQKPGDPKNEQAELSEKELEEFYMKEMEFSQKKLDLKKQYYSKFKEVLPVKKVVKLYEAERFFKKEQVSDNGGSQRGPKPNRESNF